MSKIKNTSEDFSFFQQTDPSMDKYVDRSMEIVNRIYAIMDEIGMTQKELAEKLNKKESEVSKWLSGVHNITLKSLTKLEVALGKSIMIPINGTEYLKILEREKGDFYTNIEDELKSAIVNIKNHYAVNLITNKESVVYSNSCVVINHLESTKEFNVLPSMWLVGINQISSDDKVERRLKLSLNKNRKVPF